MKPYASLSDWTRAEITSKPASMRRPNQAAQPWQRLPKGAAKLLRVARLEARKAVRP